MSTSFAVFFGIILAILGLMHFVVYKSLVSIFLVQHTQSLLALRIMFLILSVSFIAASILAGRFSNIFIRAFYTISAVWTGVLLYLFLAVTIYGILTGILFVLGSGYSTLLIGKILIVIALLTSAYGIINANNIVVTKYDVTIPNLPPSWRERQAVFVSDLHLGQINGKEFAGKINKKIAEINPDIVFDTGDLYDGVKVDAKDIISTLTFRPKLGTYFVSGNHEEYGDTVSFIKSIKEEGMVVLNDEKIDVEGVDIVGADYPTTTRADKFKEIIDRIGISKDKPTILLKHVPQNLDIPDTAGVDLALSGHTHRAQVWPLSYITKYVFKGYDYGLKKFGEMQQLTTSGAGTWGPPLRVGTKAEIVLITFK